MIEPRLGRNQSSSGILFGALCSQNRNRAYLMTSIDFKQQCAALTRGGSDFPSFLLLTNMAHKSQLICICTNPRLARARNSTLRFHAVFPLECFLVLI